MNDLVQTLLSIKSPYDSFIDRPELIEGYTEEEIKQIEQKYNISIHGQFKELLMTMGRCSGGLLTGKSLFIYNKLFEPNGYFLVWKNKRNGKMIMIFIILKNRLISKT